jgi:hypothetical protein
MPKLHKRKETKEMDVNQGCQMVYYQTKNPNLGILEGLAIEDVGIFYGLFVNFPAMWYILW